MAPEEEHKWIALMGATGSGKSTFVNVASGSDFAVSDSLESCTIDVETSTFSLDGQAVTLIDTPGFDDTVRSDTDVLKSITGFLSSSYSQGAKLAGVIYLYRITDNKMGGPSRKNFHIFRNLCGDSNLQNVLLVTNMWSNVKPGEGEMREHELASKEIFFKPALDRGARMLRHDGSKTSAHEIIRHLFDREPSAILVQDEMVNQHKDLAHTTAGADIMRELREKAERHSEALEDLCFGIDAARLAEDEETRELLQEDAMKAREDIERIRGELERMVTNFAAENSRLQDENQWYRAELKRHKTDTEQGTRERRARKPTEAGIAEASPTTSRGHQEHEERKRRKQEHERLEEERQEREKKEKEAREAQERERKERESQEREKLEREKREQEKRERKLREAFEQAQKEQERMREELKRLEEKASGSRCTIQ